MSLLEEGTWRDSGPPASAVHSTRSSPWDDVVAALKANPGVWMSFPGKSRNKPYHLRSRYPGLLAEGRHPYRDDNGTRRIELWLCWPKEDTNDG